MTGGTDIHSPHYRASTGRTNRGGPIVAVGGCEQAGGGAEESSGLRQFAHTRHGPAALDQAVGQRPDVRKSPCYIFTGTSNLVGRQGLATKLEGLLLHDTHVVAHGVTFIIFILEVSCAGSSACEASCSSSFRF